MKPNIKKTGKLLSEGLAIGTLCFIQYPMRAVVLWKFLKWFATPLGIPYITYLHSLGLILISAIFFVNLHKNDGWAFKKTEERGGLLLEDISIITVETFLKSSAILTIGFLASLFIK